MWAVIQTVTGGLDADQLGITLPHEHLFIDRSRDYGGDAYLGDVDLATREVALFKEAGGSTIVECTTRQIARQPAWLREVSERTGVHIVMGTGHYRHPYVDTAWLDAHSADQVAEEIISEIRVGVDGTAIRPGVIGEIGSNGPNISGVEERSFRAAARAQVATGLTVTTHAALFPVGNHQLDILLSEGVPANRIVVGHSDTIYSPEYHASLARRGAFVQFDTLHVQTEYDLAKRVSFVVAFVEAGFAGQLLLSHDICLRSHLTVLGGKGYAFLLNEFVPRLVEAGLSESLITEILTDNPRRALTGEL